MTNSVFKINRPMPNDKAIYRGRFAPSPSGPLHFGSLLAATASYLQAKQQQGQWWLRIEDIDPPREVEGASQHIIHTLKLYGFNWDQLSYQSHRLKHYQSYLEQLQQDQHAYPCGCSRKEIQQLNQQHTGTNNIYSDIYHGIYPGTCRDGLKGKIARSVRIKINTPTLTIDDAVQGIATLDMPRTVGDFVIKRADNLFSYHLAVAIDDSIQGMTQIVRGYDLYKSSFCQQYIRRALGLKSPSYAHIPIAVTPSGAKLSKQSAAQDISTQSPSTVLWQALQTLGQQPPKPLKSQNLEKLWQWSFTNWDLNKVPKARTIVSPI